MLDKPYVHSRSFLFSLNLFLSSPAHKCNDDDDCG